MRSLKTDSRLVDVCFPLPLDGVYTYEVPHEFKQRLGFGRRVIAPLGKKIRAGFIVGLSPSEQIEFEIKAIIDVPNEPPCFDQVWWDFIKWVANYYMAPIGLVLKTALPSGFEKRSEPYLRISEAAFSNIEGLPLHEDQINLLRSVKSDRIPLKKLASIIGKKQIEHLTHLGWLTPEEHIKPVKQGRKIDLSALKALIDGHKTGNNLAPILTSDQNSACSAISDSIARGGFEPYLLFGVTGSGKTEVYLKTIDIALKLGKRTLMLVPEIALTPQSAKHVIGRFGDKISLFHSGVTEAQKVVEWRRIFSGETQVVIATRSGIFAPIRDLGLIIVDEEHDSSYKQDEGCPYNARDLSLARGKLQNLCVVLGSATPSFETFLNTTSGRLKRIDLPTRYHGGPLPEVRLVDLRKNQTSRDFQKCFLTPPLVNEIGECLEKQHQAILFLNRRGFDTFAQCRDCGYVFKCSNCDVSLIHHKDARNLKCHLCGFSRPAPPVCPDCSSSNLYFSGVGSQKVQEELSKIFPNATIERFDRDSTSRKNQLDNILTRFRSRKIDILVGTQMIVKGHDFPGISLVGILYGDASLNFPDFRASEKTFQLLTQVAGRTGRDLNPGVVILQTFDTGHEVIRLAARHAYEEFFKLESEIRRELFYPPYGHLISIKAQGTSEKRVQDNILEIARHARSLKNHFPGVVILGPSPCPRRKVVGKFRWQIILKSPERQSVRGMVRCLIEEGLIAGHGSTITVDVDPVELM
ncbi:MAG: replication restart helicase PriA [Desulfomonilaceae bacterium]